MLIFVKCLWRIETNDYAYVGKKKFMTCVRNYNENGVVVIKNVLNNYWLEVLTRSYRNTGPREKAIFR